ncbi:hypothetical protein AB0M35_02605 [Micromonospora sp. NPDC051196]|uniref:hypothetical protein n=1 Tax=Micromonospora sp. NPDC051196 TaxID=3155281 RepID=UPI003416CC90
MSIANLLRTAFTAFVAVLVVWVTVPAPALAGPAVRAGTYAAADCPRGWFCFYDLPNFGYPRGQLSSCGWQSLSTWSWQFRVDSAHFNLDSGYVAFYYQKTQELFRISAVNRVRSDAAPKRDWATHVYRYCP